MWNPRRIIASTAPLLLLTAVLDGGAAQAAPGVRVVKFESPDAPNLFKDTTPVRDQYASKGVRFRGRNATDGGAVLNGQGGWPRAPRSGNQFLAFNAPVPMANGGSPIGPQKMLFTRKQKAVQIFVSQQQSGPTSTFTLVAKRAGKTVDLAEVSTSTDEWKKLRVTNNRGIKKVILHADDANDSWTADDLRFVKR